MSKGIDMFKILANVKKEQGANDLYYELEDTLVGWGNSTQAYNNFVEILANWDMDIQDYTKGATL
tara:strand:- start:13080 stop:13274 length:195 start_codon:yes stop_codon:yes gene_type:complete